MQDLALANVVISLCGVLLIVVNLRRLRRLEKHGLLIGSYAILCIGWVASYLDEELHQLWLNTLEHALYSVSLIMLALWLPNLRRKPDLAKHS
jgi:hypothetical protein